MKIISYADTTPALLALRKDTTRRDWTNRYAWSFQEGELVQAYSKSPRSGGFPVAIIRLTQKPRREIVLPEEDWEREGFAYLQERSLKVFGVEPKDVWANWHPHGAEHLWVVRFVVVESLMTLAEYEWRMGWTKDRGFASGTVTMAPARTVAVPGAR